LDLEVFDNAEQNETIKSKKDFLTSASIYGLMLDGLMGALFKTPHKAQSALGSFQISYANISKTHSLSQHAPIDIFFSLIFCQHFRFSTFLSHIPSFAAFVGTSLPRHFFFSLSALYQAYLMN
jgi:hypothetical protein